MDNNPYSTATMTKTVSGTKLAVATLAMFAAGGMALATVPLVKSVPVPVRTVVAVEASCSGDTIYLSDKCLATYKTFTASCHNGTSYTKKLSSCKTAAEVAVAAQQLCTGTGSVSTGKVGLNGYSVGVACESTYRTASTSAGYYITGGGIGACHTATQHADMYDDSIACGVVSTSTDIISVDLLEAPLDGSFDSAARRGRYRISSTSTTEQYLGTFRISSLVNFPVKVKKIGLRPVWFFDAPGGLALPIDVNVLSPFTLSWWSVGSSTSSSALLTRHRVDVSTAYFPPHDGWVMDNALMFEDGDSIILGVGEFIDVRIYLDHNDIVNLNSVGVDGLMMYMFSADGTVFENMVTGDSFVSDQENVSLIKNGYYWGNFPR